jgi:hypothetical protein
LTHIVLERQYFMRRGTFSSPLYTAVLAITAIALIAVWPAVASAHVKWFAPYNVPAQPRVLPDVLTLNFWQPVFWALLAFLLTCYLERSRVGYLIIRTLDSVTARLAPRVDDLYRSSTAVFFIALFAIGGIILTPELKTASPQIPWFQAAIAIGMFWRATMPLSALGIAALYGAGVAQYGIFHMLDYPIFLGLAAYLGLSGLQQNLFGLRPLDAARWAAGITLMWASVEKWAYPDWTYPLLQSNPSLCMGFSPTYYLSAAGVVEFTLAFGLLWTPLVRRLSALVLIAMFTSAIGPFGKIDAVGHLMIIVILIGIIADPWPANRREPLKLLAYYPSALAATIALYYGLHALIFGTIIW